MDEDELDEDELPTTMDELLAFAEPYTREQYDKDFTRVLARLCEKHGVTTQAEVDEIIRTHAYTHSGEDPEDEYIDIMALTRHLDPGWGK